jgi:hypothetical protein
MTETDNCIQVLREKLGTFDPGSSHYYYFRSDRPGQVQARSVSALEGGFF